MKNLFVGIDPSLTNSGVIILNEKGEVLLEKNVRSKPLGDKPFQELERINNIVLDIGDHVYSLCDSSGVVTKDIYVAIEGLAFMARNTTALIQLSALNYFLRSLVSEAVSPYVIVAPTSLKKFVTGKGNVDKDVVLMEIFKRWNFTANDQNTGDAFGLAQIARHLVIGTEGLTQPQIEVIELVKKQL